MFLTSYIFAAVLGLRIDLTDDSLAIPNSLAIALLDIPLSCKALTFSYFKILFSFVVIDFNLLSLISCSLRPRLSAISFLLKPLFFSSVILEYKFPQC